MRIKIETSSPLLPKHKCWIALSEKQERSTIHQLRKKITQDLSIKEVDPSQLLLSMDGFHLLPQTIIKDSVRDGDLITVKADNSTSVKPIERKRKLASVEEEKHDIETTVAAASISKKATAKQKDTPTSKKEEKDKKDAKKKKSKKNKDKEEVKTKDAKEKSKKDNQVDSATGETASSSSSKNKKSKKSLSSSSEEDDQVSQPPFKKHRSEPFDGLPKTKKRNMRRKLLKQQYKQKEVAAVDSNVDNKTTVENELQVQNLTISNIQTEPLQSLVKKNKNKKKNHLKQLDQRSHVHYNNEEGGGEAMEEVEEEVTTASATKESKNPYGRAFVTFVESERNYKGRNNSRKHPATVYPIHRVPTLFYADQGLNQDELADAVATTTSETAEVAAMEEVVEEKEKEEKPIDYEKDYPEITLSSDTPIGSKLVIKILEMTANYTPEISDWKQVILKGIDGDQVTFEFLPGFGKANQKGGKFDNKKHSKKNYHDDWYGGDAEEEQEEEEQEEEEKEVTFQLTDIFAVRDVS